MATPAKKAPAKAPLKSVPAKAATPKAPEPPELEGSEMTVTATLSEAKAKELGLESAPSLSVVYDFGADLDSAAEKFGADVVFNLFKDAAVIALQAKLRRAITASVVPTKAGSTTPLPADPQDLVADWTPASTGTTRKSAAEKVATMVGKLSPEERARLIAQLQESDDE